MDLQDKKLLSEYKKRRNEYLIFEDFVYNKISDIVKQHKFFVMDISHRTKGIDSLSGKLDRKSGKYADLTDITDLVGIRVICYFSDTVDLVAQVLSNEFVVDEENSVDKRKTLKDNQFGYVSLHYICSLKDEDLAKHPEFSGIRFEIQLRSVLQHAWAEIEHDLGYKSSFGVPHAITRNFSRVAGLLEIADGQFIELRDSIKSYEREVKVKISSGMAQDVSLDRVSLEAFINLNADFRIFCNRLQVEKNVEIEIISPENYLAQFEFFGIEYIGQLNDMLLRNIDMMFEMISDRLSAYELDIMTSNMILRYLCRAELVTGMYSKRQIKRFFGLIMSDEERIYSHTKKIISIQKKLAGESQNREGE